MCEFNQSINRWALSRNSFFVKPHKRTLIIAKQNNFCPAILVFCFIHHPDHFYDPNIPSNSTASLEPCCGVVSSMVVRGTGGGEEKSWWSCLTDDLKAFEITEGGRVGNAREKQTWVV